MTPGETLQTVHVDAVRGWGGGQVQALALTQGLIDSGHAVTLVCQPESALAQRAAQAGVPVELVPMRHGCDALALMALARLFRRLAPHVVHLHTSTAHTLGALAARRARVPVVVAVKRTAFAPNRSVVNRWRYTRWVDRVVAVSTGARAALVEAGVPAECVVVIHSAVDCAAMKPADRGWARRMLDLPADAAVVATVGRLSPEKGLHVLLKAAERIIAARPDARFVICGDGEAAAALREQAQQADLSWCVRFLGHRDDVRPVLAALDVFALPSLQEGRGVALLEAMAMARPAVASRAGGIPDALVEGVTGLLVPPGDASALAEAILALLRDEPCRSRMAAAARARAAAHFSREAMVRRTEALYRGLLSESGRRRRQR